MSEKNGADRNVEIWIGMKLNRNGYSNVDASLSSRLKCIKVSMKSSHGMSNAFNSHFFLCRLLLLCVFLLFIHVASIISLHHSHFTARKINLLSQSIISSDDDDDNTGSIHFKLSMVESRFVITDCTNCVSRFHLLNRHLICLGCDLFLLDAQLKRVRLFL